MDTKIKEEKMTLAIEDDDGLVCESTLDDFVRDNGDGLSDVDVTDAAHLEVGKTLYYGGGAAARFRVTRTS